MIYSGEQAVVPNPAFYGRVVGGVCRVLEVCGELEVHGEENLPDGQRTIYISSHQNPFDPAVLGTLLLNTGKEPVPFIATDALWKVPIIDRLADRMGTIPVERGRINSEGFYSRVEHALSHDTKSVAIYPEGGLRHGTEIGKVLAGGPMIAGLFGEVTVCPIVVAGMDYLDYGNLTAVVGKSFMVDKRDIPIPTDRRSFVAAARATEDVRELMKEELQLTLDSAMEHRAKRPPMSKRQRALSKMFKTVYGKFAGE